MSQWKCRTIASLRRGRLGRGTISRPSWPRRPRTRGLKAGLAKLALERLPRSSHLGARLRNYFLTGLVVVGPVTITLYIAWYFITLVDAWVKPYIPRIYNPDYYLPFADSRRRPGVCHRSASPSSARSPPTCSGAR